MREWNKLDENIKCVNYLPLFKNRLKKSKCREKNKIFVIDSSKESTNHSRIRMGLSALNYQRFSYNLITYSNCLCGNPREDEPHFLLHCPNYTAQRTRLLGRIGNLLTVLILKMNQIENLHRLVNDGFLVDIFLRGHNELTCTENLELFNHIQQFIRESGRFS